MENPPERVWAAAQSGARPLDGAERRCTLAARPCAAVAYRVKIFASFYQDPALRRAYEHAPPLR